MGLLVGGMWQEKWYVTQKLATALCASKASLDIV